MQEFLDNLILLKRKLNGIEIKLILLLSKQLLITIFNSSIKNLEEYGIRLDYIDGDTIIPQASQLVVGGLAHGFQFVDEKNLSTFTEIRDFIRKKIKTKKFRRQNISNAERLKKL